MFTSLSSCGFTSSSSPDDDHLQQHPYWPPLAFGVGRTDAFFHPIWLAVHEDEPDGITNRLILVARPLHLEKRPIDHRSPTPRFSRRLTTTLSTSLYQPPSFDRGTSLLSPSRALMPPKSKAKNTPNQHDKRHENGLAAPGKRVTKQRSNGQLNGHANGKTAVAVTPPALPSTGLNSGFKFPLPADNNNFNPRYHQDHHHHHQTVTGINAASSASANSAPPPASIARTTGFSTHVAKEYVLTAADGVGRDRTSSDASMDDVGPHGESMEGYYESASMLIGTGDASAKHRTSFAAGSTYSTVSTILTSYPLRDAIAILILLLSLPPSLVVVVQFLFASLTFVPPTAGLSLSTLPNLKEIFSWSNVGYGTLATSLSIDVVFWLGWLALGTLGSVQSAALDMSQVVIAISLSGAAAGGVSGPTFSIATCALVVCMVHVLRYRAIHLTALDYLRSVIHKVGINLPVDVPSFMTSFHSSTTSFSSSVERGWPFNIIHTILGVHIFAQGVSNCVRRGLVKHNEKDSVPSKSDLELPSACGATSRASTSTTDSLQQPHTAASSDGRPPGPSPSRSTRDSSSKKKRKQANQVRSQQPLWAAIASTKVTFVKEMEQRDAADDAREAAAMHTNTTHPTSSTSTTTTSTNTDRIWLSEVRDTEISFRVELSAESANASGETSDTTDALPSGIDRSKPFFVRVNGATWSSARITAVESESASKRKSYSYYAGEIFGLAPMSSYHCEIVSITTMRTLCSASLITQTTPSAEQAHSVPPPPPPQALRPSSPRTTLKQSIQSAESKLHETRNRARKAKKDQRAAHAHIRTEIAKLRALLEGSSANDEKNERRLLQITQHKNQADEAVAELKTQIEALGSIPAEEVASSEAKKSAWTTALSGKTAALQEVNATKAGLDRELSVIKSEISSAEDRKEKLAAKIIQRGQEFDKLVAKQQADLTARQKREQDRAQTQQFREGKENEIRYMISNLETDASNYTRKAHEAWQEITSLSNWPAQGPASYTGFGSPPTPEGTAAVPNGASSHAQVNGYANGTTASYGVPSAFAPPFHPSSNGLAPAYSMPPRGRSSSMLSQYSGFTDPDDEVFFPSAADPSSRPLPTTHQTWPVYHNGTSTTPPVNGPGLSDRKHSDPDSEEPVSAGSGAASTGGATEWMNNGSGSGSANGSNSPRPDAKPFVPGSTIVAKKQKQHQQSPTFRNPDAVGVAVPRNGSR